MDSISLDTAGEQYVRAVIKLYRTGKYFCEKEVLAKRFLNYAIDVGRYVNEVSESPNAAVKVNSAVKAMEELRNSLFILKIMQNEGYYPERLTQPVISIAEQIKTLLAIYLP